MPFGQDTGGAVLAFVTRAVKGKMERTVMKFDEDVHKNVPSVERIKDPVIVFFPNKTSQVFSLKEADKRGYLQMPEVLNLQAVEDPKSAAGRFKFAVSMEARKQAWLELEQAVISACMARGGHPLPRDCEFGDESIFFSTTEKENVA